MDPLVSGLIGIALLLVLLLLGFHVGLCLMMSGLIGIFMITGNFDTSAKMVVAAFYSKITLPELVTLPLFTLMGYLASGGGISGKIYESLSMWLGRFKSGMGIATVLACSAFGTVCGSSLVTAAVFSKIAAPEMRKCGYDKKLAYGICASGGAIGTLIPPSVFAVVYGILSGESVGKLLIAGVAPGIMLAVIFSFTIAIVGALKGSMASFSVKKYSLREKVATLKDWWTVAIVAVTIFGGLYGGVFSPNEAAAVAAFLLLLIFLSVTVFNKDRKSTVLSELVYMFKETAVTSAMIFLVLGGATIFSNLITLAGVTGKLSGFLGSAGASNFTIVLILVGLVVILGCFLDSISILCITIPAFNPIIKSAGIDPIWYATVIMMSIELGLITPPFGMNVFGTHGAAEADVKIEDIFSGCFPFFIGMAVCLVLLLLVPSISTFLPSFVE